MDLRDLDDDELQRRAELARRLKAARWLRGSLRPSDKGKTGYKVTELSQGDLANRIPAENGFTGSLIGAIERMERPTKPMERAAIAEALDLPGWFEGEATSQLEELAGQIEWMEQVLSGLAAALQVELPVRPQTGKRRRDAS